MCVWNQELELCIHPGSLMFSVQVKVMTSILIWWRHVAAVVCTRSIPDVIVLAAERWTNSAQDMRHHVQLQSDHSLLVYTIFGVYFLQEKRSNRLFGYLSHF